MLSAVRSIVWGAVFLVLACAWFSAGCNSRRQQRREIINEYRERFRFRGHDEKQPSPQPDEEEEGDRRRFFPWRKNTAESFDVDLEA